MFAVLYVIMGRPKDMNALVLKIISVASKLSLC